MTFLDIIAKEIGSCICNKLGVQGDFGKIAQEIEDTKRKENKVFYAIDEKEIKITDTKPFVGFHIFKEARPTRSKSPFAHVGGNVANLLPCKNVICMNADMSFVLFGFIDCDPSKVWNILDCFNQAFYNFESKVEAEVIYTKFQTSPRIVVKDIFKGDFPKIQHKQQKLISIRIDYTAKITTCSFCF